MQYWLFCKSFCLSIRETTPKLSYLLFDRLLLLTCNDLASLFKDAILGTEGGAIVCLETAERAGTAFMGVNVDSTPEYLQTVTFKMKETRFV